MSTAANTMFGGGRAAPAFAATTGELFDRELILKYMAAGAFWLVFAPTIGAIVSIKFNYYDFLGHVSWLTWGRLRPVHVMGPPHILDVEHRPGRRLRLPGARLQQRHRGG